MNDGEQEFLVPIDPPIRLDNAVALRGMKQFYLESLDQDERDLIASDEDFSELVGRVFGGGMVFGAMELYAQMEARGMLAIHTDFVLLEGDDGDDQEEP